MTTIVQISDTHFGTEVPDVVKALRELLINIAPQIIVLSGDVTQRARRSQFEAAETFMHALSAEVKMVIPGNHDIPLYNVPARIFTPYANYRAAFGSLHSFVSYNEGKLGILGFNTTSRWRHTRGYLGEKALRQLVAQARQSLAQDALLIASIHQPLATALPQDTGEILIHADQTAQLFAKQGIDLVMSGHVHMPLISTTHEVFRGLSRPFILCGAGTAISRRTRPGAPNSFNTITIEETRRLISITRYDYSSDSKTFSALKSHHFQYSNQGWNKL